MQNYSKITKFSAKTTSHGHRSGYVDNVSWVYDCDIETKAQSSQWRHPEEPRPKKACHVRSNVKVLLTVFLDSNSAVHHEFLPQVRTVNKEYYLKVKSWLREAIVLADEACGNEDCSKIVKLWAKTTSHRHRLGNGDVQQHPEVLKKVITGDESLAIISLKTNHLVKSVQKSQGLKKRVKFG